jgi:hypothetical protein|tara:strand:+ start:329 stop:940 length:612 start_codon:yes stop_codon:yes gene_type:complete
MKSFGFFNNQENYDPFTDLLFNALLGFVFMFAISFILINPSSTVVVNADFIITITWPDEHPDDIDTYVEDPSGNVLWFHSKEVGLMHLDRDDRGNYKDTIIVEGKKIRNVLNQETVTIRGIVAGEYVVNIYHYLATGVEDVPVKVKIEKIHPQVTVMFYQTYLLTGKGDQITAARFVLDNEGKVLEINRKQKNLIEKTRQKKG